MYLLWQYRHPVMGIQFLRCTQQGHVKVQHACNGGCPWRSLVKSPGTRLGEAQCRRSREFLPPGRDLRPARPSFGNSNPAAGGKRPRTGRRFHSASERDIPQYKDQCLIPHFDGALVYLVLRHRPVATCRWGCLRRGDRCAPVNHLLCRESIRISL
jgi:hypothetical protein